jgi:hypothetical protein
MMRFLAMKGAAQAHVVDRLRTKVVLRHGEKRLAYVVASLFVRHTHGEDITDRSGVLVDLHGQ